MKVGTEVRWLVIASDGRHTTLGRHTDPSDEEIANTEVALLRSGLGGWLVVMHGRYYDARTVPRLMMVRVLGEPTETWDQASAAFEAIRHAASQPG